MYQNYIIQDHESFMPDNYCGCCYICKHCVQDSDSGNFWCPVTELYVDTRGLCDNYDELTF